MATLLTLGEAMGVAWTDVGDPVRTATRLTLSTAGAEATVAIGFRRLGHSATFVGRVGADAVGHRVRRDLQAEGVRVDFLATDENARTGFMLRDRATSELLSVTYWRDGSAGSRLAAGDVDAAFAATPEIDVVHLTGITACLSDSSYAALRQAVSLARRRGVLVSLDVNLRRSLPAADRIAERLQKIISDVDLLFVGDDELHVVCDQAEVAEVGMAAEQLLARGPREVVVKRGADGASAFVTGGARSDVEAFNVVVADVVGAGDSFVAGYLTALVEAMPVQERLGRGALCAALTVGTHGDWQGLPMRAALDRAPSRVTTIR